MTQLNSETNYNKALKEIWELMQKDEKLLTKNEVKIIADRANAIQEYEAIHYPFPFSKQN